MKNDEQGAMERLLDGLEKQTDCMSNADLKAELRGRNIEPDDFLKTTKSIIDSAKKTYRLGWMKLAKANKQKILEAGAGLVSWLTRQPEEVEKAFEILVAEAPLAFRNKGKLSVEDKARLLDDLEKLKRRTSDRNISEGNEPKS